MPEPNHNERSDVCVVAYYFKAVPLLKLNAKWAVFGQSMNGDRFLDEMAKSCFS